MTAAIILVVFPFCMVYSAISDLLSMTIANRVSVILIATFAVAAPFTGLEWQSIGVHFLTAFCVLMVTFSLFAFGTMGGGDAKLIASTSLWFGFGIPLMEYLLYAGLIGGVLTIVIVFYRNSAVATMSGHISFLRNFADDKKGIPYGIALGAGGLLAFPSSPMGAWVISQAG